VFVVLRSVINRLNRRHVALCIASTAVVLVSACGDDGAASATSAPPCPVASTAIVVTVDQWGDIVGDLAGRCGDVTTIVKGDAGDPHDYEPTPADNATFAKAKLVVVNGADYDHWSFDAIDTLRTKPPVVDAAEVAGVTAGQNPHIWYSPDDVAKVAEAVTAELKALAPGAATYFDERHAAWVAEMKPYNDAVANLRVRVRLHGGRAGDAEQDTPRLSERVRKRVRSLARRHRRVRRRARER
jgi:zinc/manganese transport system substrate-binding protein